MSLIMQKGQVVRKMLSSGDVIGPYCVILGFSGINCSLVRVESFDGVINQQVKRERLRTYKMAKTIISHRVYERLSKGLQHSIIHDPTGKWRDMYEKQPEVIQIRSELYTEKTLTFVVDEIKKIYQEGNLRIRLDLGEQLL